MATPRTSALAQHSGSYLSVLTSCCQLPCIRNIRCFQETVSPSRLFYFAHVVSYNLHCTSCPSLSARNLALLKTIHTSPPWGASPILPGYVNHFFSICIPFYYSEVFFFSSSFSSLTPILDKQRPV